MIDPHMKWVLRSQLKQLHKPLRLHHGLRHARPDRGADFRRYGGGDVRGRRSSRSARRAELFERPSHTFVGYFIGSPGMNVLPVDARRRAPRGSGRQASRCLARAEVGRAPRPSSASGPEYRPARPRGAAGHDQPGRGYRPAQDRAGRRSRAGSSRSIVPEHDEIPAEPRVVFDPKGINLYADSLARRAGGLSMEKTWNNKAWFMVLPVLVLVAFSAIIPLMTVVNYSVQDTFGNNVVLLGRHRVVRRPAAFAALLGGAGAQPGVLGDHPRHRGAARHLHRAQHAQGAAGACRSASC